MAKERTKTSRGKMPTDVKALARVHTETALKVLAGIMSAVDAQPSARVAAATAILNRGWGQPQQAVELSGEVVTSKVIRTPMISTDNETWLKQHSETLQ